MKNLKGTKVELLQGGETKGEILETESMYNRAGGGKEKKA